MKLTNYLALAIGAAFSTNNREKKTKPARRKTEQDRIAIDRAEAKRRRKAQGRR